MDADILLSERQLLPIFATWTQPFCCQNVNSYPFSLHGSRHFVGEMQFLIDLGNMFVQISVSYRPTGLGIKFSTARVDAGGLGPLVRLELKLGVTIHPREAKPSAVW